MRKLLLLALPSGIALLLGALAWHALAPPAATSERSSASLKSSPASRQQPAPTLSQQSSTQGSAPEDPLSLERRCLAIAEDDPRQAVEFAIDSGLCDTNTGLLENLTAQWAARDFDAAHGWAQQQEAGELRDALLARIAFAGSQSNPLAAAQIVVTEMAPGPRQNEAAISVLHQWAQIDLEAAAAWAANFPAGDFRKRAMAEIEGVRKSRQATLDSQ
jgi:hypothetical protein